MTVRHDVVEADDQSALVRMILEGRAVLDAVSVEMHLVQLVVSGRTPSQRFRPGP
jgi:hypothetical protein